MQGSDALDTGPFLLWAETPLHAGHPPLVPQLSVQGQRLLVQLICPPLVAPHPGHVPEVDQRECHAGFVAQLLVYREALLAGGPSTLEVPTPERRDRQVGQGVGAAPPVTDLSEVGQALFVAGERTLRVSPMAIDATEGDERNGDDPRIARSAAQSQALFAQRGRPVVVSLRPCDLSQLDEDVGRAAVVPEHSVDGEGPIEELRGACEVALPEGQLSCPVQRLGPQQTVPWSIVFEGFREKPLGPAPSLFQIPAHPPEPAQRPHQAQARTDIAGFPRPVQGLPQVVVFLLEPPQPQGAFGPQENRPCPLHQDNEVFGVPPARGAYLPAFLEALERVLPDRLEHDVPRPVCPGTRRHQRLLYQAPERFGDLLRLDLTRRADLLRGLERKAARENRKAPQQGLLPLCQQVVAPVEGAAHRPLPLGKIARPGRTQSPIEARQESPRVHKPRLGRREFQRERQTGEPPADRRDVPCVLLGDRKVGGNRPGALEEEPARRGLRKILSAKVAGGRGQRQGRDGVLLLAAYPQGRPAGRERDKPGTPLEKARHLRGRP